MLHIFHTPQLKFKMFFDDDYCTLYDQIKASTLLQLLKGTSESGAALPSRAMNKEGYMLTSSTTIVLKRVVLNEQDI